MKLIGFAGQGRVGKTTVANDLCKWIIRETTHLTPLLMPFAGPLKKEVALAYGYTSPEEFKTDLPVTYREECQRIGNGRRQEDSNYWVNKWKEAVNFKVPEEIQTQEHDYVVVVDDVRYQNEVDIVHSMGGTVHFITSGKRPLDDATAMWRNHESEALANNSNLDYKMAAEIFDGFVYNDETEQDLLKMLKKAYPSWLGLNVGMLLDPTK